MYFFYEESDHCSPQYYFLNYLRIVLASWDKWVICVCLLQGLGIRIVLLVNRLLSKSRYPSLPYYLNRSLELEKSWNQPCRMIFLVSSRCITCTFLNKLLPRKKKATTKIKMQKLYNIFYKISGVNISVKEESIFEFCELNSLFSLCYCCCFHRPIHSTAFIRCPIYSEREYGIGLPFYQ